MARAGRALESRAAAVCAAAAVGTPGAHARVQRAGARGLGDGCEYLGRGAAAAAGAGGPRARLRPGGLGESRWRAGLAATPRAHGAGGLSGGRLDPPQGRRGDQGTPLVSVALAAPGAPRPLGGRRRVREPTDLTASVVFAPPASALEAVVRVAGSRWTVESCGEAAQGEGGRDQEAGRRWTGWYRPLTLAMGA